MATPGEMPAAGPARAVSERWIDDRAALVAGGPVRRVVARGRERRIEEARGGLMSPGGVLALAIADALEPPGVLLRYAEVDLYPVGAEAGALPEGIVPFPVDGVLEALERQGRRVDVRGVVAPGRGIALVLDDGTVVGCIGPVRPVPALRRRRRRL